MYNKNKNHIFELILALLVVIAVAGMLFIKNGDDKKDKQNLSQEELAELSEEEQNEQEALEQERIEINEAIKNADTKAEYHKGEYKDRGDSREINMEFIVTDEYKFRQILSYSEIEFIGYEELDDLSEYFKDVVVKDNQIVDYANFGFLNDMSIDLREGRINSDGTFNTVEEICKIRYGDLNYGEEVYSEKRELMGIRLTVKYTNLLATENKLILPTIHEMEKLIVMDDEKLYRSSSIFNSNHIIELTYTWSNMMDKFEREGLKINTTSIVLQPYEEYIGELVFVCFREDFDDMYMIINAGEKSDIENFNAVDVKLLPFSELKKLED